MFTGTTEDISCFGEDDGTITLEFMPACVGCTFSWVGADGFTSSDQNLTDLPPGGYIVTINYPVGCSAEGIYAIDEPAEILIDLDASLVTCSDGNDGAINATTTNGIGMLTYSWTGPDGFTSTDEDISSLFPGTYVLTVTDETNCLATQSVTLAVPETFSVVETISSVLCAGESTGAINLTISNGVPPYQTNWTGPNGFSSTLEDISSLEAGSYTVVITDFAMCSLPFTYEVTELTPLSLAVSDVTDVLCFGQNTGAIDIGIIGGLGPYDVEWSGPDGFTSISEDIDNLVAGDYMLLVTDANGCELNQTIPVDEPAALVVTATPTQPGCSIIPNGSIDLNVSGGSPTYNISWTGPNGFTSMLEDISGLTPGTYEATVIDDNGCQQSIELTLAIPDPIVITENVEHVECNGEATGAITIAISNGTPMYDISWTGPNGFTANTLTIENLVAGTYTVVVFDADDCTSTKEIEVNENSLLSLSSTFTEPDCNGALTGQINVTASGGAPLTNGGNPLYFFEWTGPDGFSSIQEDLSNVAAGNYELTLSDSLGCEVTQMFMLDEPSPIAIVGTVQDIDCFGQEDGVISVSASGGMPDYTYSWAGPGGFTSSSPALVNLGAGDYLLTVTDGNDCQKDSLFVIEEPDQLIITTTVVQPSCSLDNGSLDVSVTGGTVAADYLYTVRNGNNMVISIASFIDNLPVGTYEITVTDDNGCSAVSTIVLSNDGGTLSATVIDVSCPGQMDGSIDLEVAGLTGDLTYAWNGPGGFSAATQDLDDLGGGVYQVIVEDELGCTLFGQYTVVEPTTLNAVGLIEGESCAGENDGSIDITVSGGTPDYMFEWSGPNGYTSMDDDISGLEPGAYQLVVTDDNGCGGLFFFNITEGIDISLSGTVTSPLCEGDETGSVSVDLTPAIPGTSFQWSGPNGYTSMDEDIANLPFGTYTVIVTTPQFCTLTDSFDVLEASAVVIDLDIQEAQCGESTGSASATVSGGTVLLDYDYEYVDLSDMSVVGTTAILSNAPAGTYVLTVTDDNGCEATEQFSISDNSGSITATVLDLGCLGDEDGSIDITIVGAAEPFTVSWTGPDGFTSTEQDLNDLAAGEYSLIVADAEGCTLSETYTVEEGSELALQTTIDPVNCFGEASGSISITHTNGTPPFVHAWSGPDGYTSTDEDIDGLAAGSYAVFYTDANNCTGLEVYEVTEPGLLLYTGTLTHNDCFEDLNGAIDIFAVGGTGPYEPSWTGPNGFTSDFLDINGLATGIYTLILTDASGCMLEDSYEILSQDPIVVDVVTLNNTSCDMNDGSVTVAASGGNGGYTYSWQNGMGTSIGNGASLDDLAPDEYTVTVTDINMCSTTSTIEIFNTEVTFSADISNPDCSDVGSGSIDLTVVGNPVMPFVFAWTGPDGYTSNLEDISDLSDGSYSVILTDDNDCVFSDVFIISSPAPLNVTGIHTDVECNGTSTGSIEATITGGTQDYSTEWVGPDGFTSDSEDLVDLPAGVYTLSVTDANGCPFTFMETIEEPDPIMLTGTVTDPECEGIDNGAINVEPGGGQGMLQYSWEGPDGFTSIQEDLVSLAVGTYVLTVTDLNGCQQSETFILEGGDALNNVLDITNLDCFGDTDASISTAISGGTPDYFYSWTGPNGYSSGETDIDNLEPGVYFLVVIDDLGCIRRDTIDIVEPSQIDLSDAVLTDPLCFGTPSGTIDITVTGGTADYTYEWTYPNNSTNEDEDISGLPPGNFNLEVTDANGCTNTNTFLLNAPPEIEVAVEDIQSTECEDNADGSIDITASGGSGMFEYSWVGPNGSTFDTEDLVDIFSGLYSVTVTDASDCSYEETFIVTSNNALQADAGTYPPVCTGSNVTLDGSNSTSANSYSWSTLSGQVISGNEDVDVTANAESSVFILTTSNDACISTDTVYLSVNPLPTPDAGGDVDLFFQEEATLGGSPTATGNVTYDWEPSNLLEGANTANPTFVVDNSVVFIVTVTDENGCIGSDFVEVSLIPNVSVPDGFSPNGDQINDRWRIGNSNQFPEMTVVVVNRWGNTVFNSDGYRTPWDGKFEDVDVPVGTYYYVIELNDAQFPDPVTGPVTIFR